MTTKGLDALTLFDRLRETDEKTLQTEYQKLVDGLRDANIARETDVILSNPGNFSVFLFSLRFLL